MTSFNEDSVRGFLHEPERSGNRGIVLTHGAGGNAKTPLLVLLAEAFCETGYHVLRCDMAFRQRKAGGPPSPSTAALDRASLCDAVTVMRRIMQGGTVFLGGQSYGGRQSTILAAEQPGLVEALLLLSYPLHPPGKPDKLRTEHFPSLRTPALFLQGTSDPFGSIEEVTQALKLIPAKHELIEVAGAGHDLGGKKFALAPTVVEKLGALAALKTEHHA
jgi:uncharacterized protein